MKKFLLSFCLAAVCIGKTMAYTTVTVQDSISTNTHWTCDNQYLLKGYVYVTAGATLTIDPGTIIKGDKDTKGALIIERNAKIIATGTRTSPIIFTSNQAPGTRTYGDWGGVILCGNAPTNWTAEPQVEGGPRSKYGGSDPHDNSGTMQYVRIEFAGIAFSPNNEVNGLTFCGIGDATTIDHIQVSYSGDDAYEFFGGNVNTKYMVAFRTWDDDFDTDNGYQGKDQFCVVVRDPYSADVSGSKAFESDSYQGTTNSGIPVDNTKLTKPVFSNCTVIGPMISPTSTAYDPQFIAGIQIRRGSAISVVNSIFAGWPCGVLVDESSSSFGSTVGNIGLNELQFRHNIISGIPVGSPIGPKEIVFVKDGARSLTSTATNADTTGAGTDWSVMAGASYPGPWTWLLSGSNANKIYATEQTGVILGNPFNLSNPNLVPNSTSPIVYNALHPFNTAHAINYDTSGGYVNYNVPGFAPDFIGNKASDPFFTVTNYVGAFAGTGTTSDNWMNGWCNFDPNNENYDTTCYVAPPPPPPDTATGVAHIENSSIAAKVFPNPAQDKATLLLDIKNAGLVKVAIVDATGKKVKEIMNGELSKGVQSIEFTTDDLCNGFYLITINSDSKQKTLRLKVVR